MTTPREIRPEVSCSEVLSSTAINNQVPTSTKDEETDADEMLALSSSNNQPFVSSMRVAKAPSQINEAHQLSSLARKQREDIVALSTDGGAGAGAVHAAAPPLLHRPPRQIARCGVLERWSWRGLPER